MKTKFIRLITVLFFVLIGFFNSIAQAISPSPSVQWNKFSDEVFQRASKEKKLVLLDLEAVWCHWCHVMEQETYGNPKIQQIIARKFIAVKVDQDSRPDLSNRYGDYGWPATIIFDAQGGELRKLRGFQEPTEFMEILEAVIKKPVAQDETRTPIFVKDALLTPELKQHLLASYFDNFDYKLGGLDAYHKFIFADLYELTLHLTGQSGEAGEKARNMAKLSLDGALKLIDPVWGGAYQYSTDRDWDHPHYEKIMQYQSDNIRLYSEGYLIFKDEKYLSVARSVASYVTRFLTAPQGGFYTSQDADLIKGQHSEEYFKLNDQERMAKGIPAIDNHRYSRENGWMIRALAGLYSASLEKTYLDSAIASAKWVLANRSLASGGFRHDEADPAGPYLGDTLAMGRGFVALYAVTGNRDWLDKAAAAADFVAAEFSDKNSPGFFTASPRSAGIIRPVKLVDENIELARFSNLLGRYSGKSNYREISESALRYLVTPVIAKKERTNPGILLASEEFSTEPVHITVVGHKDDAEANKLFQSGLSYYAAYKRLDWWDKREGPMPNPDVQYPELDRPAAFVCGYRRCSLPIFDGTKIAEVVQKFANQSGAGG